VEVECRSSLKLEFVSLSTPYFYLSSDKQVHLYNTRNLFEKQETNNTRTEDGMRVYRALKSTALINAIGVGEFTAALSKAWGASESHKAGPIRTIGK
jgi:hypothetical protein